MRSIAVVGAGGLGCPALLALGDSAAITIVDDDRVDISNLQRQILYRTDDVGRWKAEAAQSAMQRRWPAAPVTAVVARLDETNAHDLINGHHVVIDGSDSFETKFLLNDMCIAMGIPLVHGAVVGWTGQVMTVLGRAACYRCIFEEAPTDGLAATCSEAGVVGAVAGTIGALMAQEARAILDGRPELAGVLLRFDAVGGRWRRLAPRIRAGCPAHAATEVATC